MAAVLLAPSASIFTPRRLSSIVPLPQQTYEMCEEEVNNYHRTLLRF
jgi:hypothetical protein